MRHFQSLRISGALGAGVFTAVLVYFAGQVFSGMERDDQAESMKTQAFALMQEIARQTINRIETGDGQGLEHWLDARIKRQPGWSVRVADLQGKILAAAGPDGDGRPLSRLLPATGGLLTGSLNGVRLLEGDLRIQGTLASLGTVRVRARLTESAWLASLSTLSLICGGLAFLLAWGWLAFLLRGAKGIEAVLEGASREEFWHRAHEAGAGEIRTLARRANAAMEALTDGAVRVRKVYLETALALTRTVEAKDRYTSGHSQRVARYAVEIGEWLGFDEDRLETLRLGALLHDIGKVAVPDSVLLKPGPLDDEEFELMKGHPMAGDRILSAIPGMRDVADVARSHHEKWDGSGYPLRVAGDAIPLEGRIVAIADAYDAMVTKRSYKAAMPLEKALAILVKDAGSHFDPSLVELFVSMKKNGKGYRALRPESMRSGPESEEKERRDSETLR